MQRLYRQRKGGGGREGVVWEGRGVVGGGMGGGGQACEALYTLNFPDQLYRDCQLLPGIPAAIYCTWGYTDNYLVPRRCGGGVVGWWGGVVLRTGH